MTLTTKILLVLLALTIICSGGFVMYKLHQMSAQQDAINKSIVEFKQLQDGIARSSAQYATKDDLNNFAKQNNINLDAIRQDLSTLNATVTGINQVTVVSGGQTVTNAPSTSTDPNTSPTSPIPTVDCNGQQVPCSNADPFGYLRNRQNLNLNEQFGSTQVPIGEVGFSAWQQTPWNMTIYPRAYSVTNVLGTDTDGRHYVYNKFSITSNNKTYPITISDAKFVEEYPAASFSWWNPRIYAGVDGAVNITDVTGDVVPSVNVGVLSYGQSKVNPDWSFAQVGLGYGAVHRKFQFQLSPAQYNVGKIITPLKNTYIGPSVGLTTNGGAMLSLGIRVSF